MELTDFLQTLSIGKVATKNKSPIEPGQAERLENPPIPQEKDNHPDETVQTLSGEYFIPQSSPETEPPSAQFSVGQVVRFSHMSALNILDGMIVEAKWHPAPISRWWYLVRSGEKNFWNSESQIRRDP